jgi:hypothetical protein
VERNEIKSIGNMKVVCIDNTIGNSRWFKIGQVLEKRDMTEQEKKKYRLPYDYIIISGFNFLNQSQDIWCLEQCFVSLEEWRNNKLNELEI